MKTKSKGKGQTLAAVIVAAGASERYGTDKALSLLGDAPVIQHSIDLFASVKQVVQTVVVAGVDNWSPIRDLIHSVYNDIPVLVRGGARRQDSVYHGLGPVEAEGVLVHDAARPLASPNLLKRIVAMWDGVRGVVPVWPVSDTLLKVDAHGVVKGGVPRLNVYRAQTPQLFPYSALLNAYEQAIDKRKEFTDDATLFAWAGGAVVATEGEATNLKLTFPKDLISARAILEARHQRGD
jgi:2-C-methyl-D-erythritol 4-phosphate cytidylyltransferase